MTKQRPFITISIPSLNRIKSFKLVVDSVLSQSFQDFELLIVDDCSDQDIKNYIHSLKNKKIRLILHKKRQGFKNIFTKCLLLAKGKYVMTLGNDDILCGNNVLEKIYGRLKREKNIGLAKIGLIYYYKDLNRPCFSTKIEEKDVYIKNTDYMGLFKAVDDYGLTHIAGTIYQRDLLNKNIFSENQLMPFFKTLLECATKKNFIFIANSYVAVGMSTSYLAIFTKKQSYKESWFYEMFSVYSQYLDKRVVKKFIVERMKGQIPFFVAIKNYVGPQAVLVLMKEYIQFEQSFLYDIKLYLSVIFSLLIPEFVFLFAKDLRYKMILKNFRPPKQYYAALTIQMKDQYEK